MADELARQVTPRIVLSATPEDAVSGADVIVTATTAASPVFPGEWVMQGTHVCAIGAHDATSRELDSALIRRASTIAVDSREACLTEAGDLLIPVSEAILDPSRIVELGEVLWGSSQATLTDITIYKSVGIASLDAAAAALALANAKGGFGVTVAWP